jgi:DNA invertase Pin-like site-specific DNA recombinase
MQTAIDKKVPKLAAWKANDGAKSILVLEQPKLNEEQIAHARDLQNEGRGLREIGKLVGCHASTVCRALQNKQQEEK